MTTTVERHDLDGASSAPAWPIVDDGQADTSEPNPLSFGLLAGVALLSIGGLLVMFFAYLFVFSPVTASRNQQHLTQTLIGHPLAVYGLVGGAVPPQGSAVAVIQIPAIGLHQVVVEGTSAADLMNGPGLMRETALPGTPGNAVIAARRVTFGGPFGSIGTLHIGDRIRIIDGVGPSVYRVTKVETVGQGRRDVVGPTAANRLTLITSDSSLVASGRQVVQAKLVGEAIAGKATPKVPKDDLALSGDSVAGWLALLWSIVTVAVVLAAVVVAIRWRRAALTYLFAVPVVLMCALFACQALARALPATF